jgi:hypothetical protein
MNNKVFVAHLFSVGYGFTKLIIPLRRNLRMLRSCSNVYTAVNLERTARTSNCCVLYTGGYLEMEILGI